MCKPYLIFAALSVGALASSAAAQTPPPIAAGTARAYLDLTADAGSAAIDMAVPTGEPPNRMFFVTQGGTVRLYKNGALQAANYFNVASYVSLRPTGEQGLLGFAFHPQFNAVGSVGYGKFYTFTSENKGTDTADFTHPELGTTGGTNFSVITEWTTNPMLDAITTMPTRRVLMRINQPQTNHNGGALRFGNDNLLYISTGDGGGGNDEYTNTGQGITLNNDGHTNSTGNAQDITNVHGKILRINPLDPDGGGALRYSVPSDNPFAGPTAGVDEIFAHGLRNPFRMNFDRATGKLYVGDVGQGQREEVDVIQTPIDPSQPLPAGVNRNYGWVYMEGTRPNRTPPGGFSSVAPIGEYTSGDGHSVIGGFVYHGSIPELQGRYVFGDYNGNASRGRLFHMPANGGTIQEFVYSGPLLAGATHPINSTLYGWGEDAQGELYALFADGNVRRMLGDHQWRPTSGGSWDTATNWTSGTGFGASWTSVAPNAAGAQARFLNGPTGPVTVTLSSNKTVGTLLFSNANRYTIAGTGLIMNGAGATASINVADGSHTIAAPVTLATNTTANVTPAASVLTLSGGVAAAPVSGTPGSNLTKSGAGTLEVSRFNVNRLTVSAGTMKVLPNGGAGGLSRASELVISGGATLNLADNDILIDYAPGLSPYATLAGYALDGRDGAGGIVVTPGTGPSNDRALGLAEATDLPPMTDWLGEPIDDNTIIGRYTYYGDGNLDGKVTSDDYVVVDVGLGRGTRWSQGDFNYSGGVTSDDYVAIDTNLGKGTANPAAFAQLKAEMIALHAAMFGDEYLAKVAYAEEHGFGAIVPEPRTASIIGLVAIVVFARRTGHRPLGAGGSYSAHTRRCA